MNDIYIKVGQVLELIQLFEKEFKELTIKCHIVDSDDKRSLSNMNSYLLRNNYIDINEFILIKKVIEIRNYVIHRLFIDEENKLIKLDEMKDSIEIVLNIFRNK